MNFKEEDAKLLNVWQTFQFKLEDSDKTSAERAEAARSLMLQVHNLFERGSLNDQQYETLLNYYEKQYCDIVDEQDDSKGLNNFAEQSLALISGFRNDSQNWKSSVTFESLDNFNISKIPAKDYKTTKPMESFKPPNIKPNDALKVPSSKSKTVTLPYQRDPVFKRQTTCPNVKPLFSKDDRMDKMNDTSRRTEVERNGPENYNNNPNSSFITYKRQPSRQKTQKTLSLERETMDEKEEENVDNEFVSARQQFIINERKKKGKNENGQNMGSYGTSKKSLGYRRGPSNRFIPPVRNHDGDDDDDETVESYQPKKDNRTKATSRSKNDSSADSDEMTDERLKGIEPKMVELINNEIMDHGPPVDWNDIAGLEFAKTVIKEIVVWPMLRPDIFKGLRGPPKGLLLFGPPGTGKTLIGKCIASQSKATFFSISASSLTSKWVGEGEKMVRALFAVARCNQPAVIFIDEIDSLLSQRSDGEHDSSRRIKTEFLVQLGINMDRILTTITPDEDTRLEFLNVGSLTDGATTSSDDRLLVIGATNRPQEIDEAARRRLVKRLYIPLPEGGARRQIITNLLKDQRYSLSEEDFGKLVERSEGYSGSDMSNLCREAALGPIRSISGDIQAITPDQVRSILVSDFDNAFKQVRASVSSKDLDLYVEWNKQFGSGH